MDVFYLGLAFVLGPLASAAVVWIVCEKRASDLNGQVIGLNAELTLLRDATIERDHALAAASEARERLAGAEGRLEGVMREVEELATSRRRVIDLESENSTLKANLEAAAAGHVKQVEILTTLRKEIEDNFELLAGRALGKNADGFLQQAKVLFENQKELAKVEIDNLVKPLGESLKAYEVALQDIEKARTQSYGSLVQAIGSVQQQHEQVRSVTANLVNALKASPKTRGRWGEETLRRVMELSGMVEHCDFETEKHYRSDDENLRPDAVILVSGDRSIIVDAKAPLTAYLEAVSATNEDERDLLLKRHAAQLRERLTNLSSKSYWERFAGSPDCVVMFVPGDNFVSAAFERDPTLFEDGIKARVLICTPTTFIALAKAISYGWRQERMAKSALEVAALGKELYARLCKFGDHVAYLGKHLKDAVKKYNDFVGSLESSVLPQARRFNELGVEGTAEPLPSVVVVDTVVRFPQRERDLSLPGL